MQLSKKKNTIILKGMASNVVEEAIVVLKPNVKIKQNEYKIKKTQKASEENQKIIIVNEAQKTIENYVMNLQKNSKSEIGKIKKKYIISQIYNVILTIGLIISISILI